ncbi:unnamed protein product, partial [Rotaria sp. Silwood1]
MYFRRYRLFKILFIFICLIIALFPVYNVLFNSIKQEPFIRNKETISTISFDLNKDFEEISEDYSPFYIRLPNFSDDEAKNWFYNSTYY